MSSSDDGIEEMVRSAIFLFAEDEEKRTAALQWLDKRVAAFNSVTELGLLDGETN
jgi:hypothetical protein